MPAFIVSARESHGTVLELLRLRLGLSWSKALRLVHQGRVRLGAHPCLDPSRRTKRGQRLEVVSRPTGQSRPIFTPATKEHKSLALRPVIRYLDAHVVVADKPAGLTTMRHPEETAEFGRRAGRFLPATLADGLAAHLAEKRSGKHIRVRAVHRLDKETSGLVVFALTPQAESDLGRQFRAHTIERHYLAIVRGQAKPGRIKSYLVRDRGDGRRGSSPQPELGKLAVTHVRVVEQLGNYTLVECRLETGRTHQVRIHLGESGTPLCGERIYDRPIHGRPLPDKSDTPRLALHAASLGFKHPATGKWMKWESPLAKDLSAVVSGLRKRRFQKD